MRYFAERNTTISISVSRVSLGFAKINQTVRTFIMPLENFPAVATIPVQWGDQDVFKHVNNAHYFRWFESSRVEYWHKSGLFDALKGPGYGPILASVTCNYKRQIKFPDTVLVGTKVEKMGVSSVTLTHDVFSETCLLYTSPSPRDKRQSRMPSSA